MEILDCYSMPGHGATDDVGNFLTGEIENNMHVELLDGGLFYGDLQIGTYHAIFSAHSLRELRSKAVHRIRKHLMIIIASIEEDK